MTLITGYRGLAEELINRLGSQGSVSVLVRDPGAIAGLEKRFPEVLFVAGDVVNGADGKNWVDRSLERFGRIDCLINNAAVSGPAGRTHDISFVDFRLAIDIDFLAPVRLTKFVLPHFLKQNGGVVINLSGGGATQGRPFFNAYACAKTALVRFTETLAIEYPEFRFYAVSPGALMTPMIEKLKALDRATIGSEWDEAQRRSKEGGEDPLKAVHLIQWLIEHRPEELNGAVLSAVWDDVKAAHLPHSAGWWRLRRVDEVLLSRLKSSKKGLE